MSRHIRFVLQQCLLEVNYIQNDVKIVPLDVIETIGKLKLFERIEVSPSDRFIK